MLVTDVSTSRLTLFDSDAFLIQIIDHQILATHTGFTFGLGSLAMATQDEVTALVKDVMVAQHASNNRQLLLTAAKKLVIALEDPAEEAWRFALQPCAQACMCSAWKCGLLQEWPKERMSSEDLASTSNANQRLVGECVDDDGNACVAYALLAASQVLSLNEGS